jgi:hypothetical protein
MWPVGASDSSSLDQQLHGILSSCSSSPSSSPSSSSIGISTLHRKGHRDIGVGSLALLDC